MFYLVGIQFTELLSGMAINTSFFLDLIPIDIRTFALMFIMNSKHKIHNWVWSCAVLGVNPFINSSTELTFQ